MKTSKKIGLRADDITSLRNDGSSGNHNDWPVEFALEVAHNLISNSAEGVQRSVRDLDEETLGS